MKKYKQSKFKLMIQNEAEKGSYSPPVEGTENVFFQGMELVSTGEDNGRNNDKKGKVNKVNTLNDERK